MCLECGRIIVVKGDVCRNPHESTTEIREMDRSAWSGIEDSKLSPGGRPLTMIVKLLTVPRQRKMSHHQC